MLTKGRASCLSPRKEYSPGQNAEQRVVSPPLAPDATIFWRCSPMAGKASVLAPALILLAGCMNLPIGESPTPQVAGNPFGAPPQPTTAVTKTNFAPAEQQN